MRRWIKWIIAAGVLVVLAVTLGPFIYIHFIEPDPPARLQVTADSGSGATSPAASSVPASARKSLAGTWKVTSGSQAGYRVDEVLFGQDNTAVGRTSAVTGSITISGTRVTEGEFTVDLTSVASDQSRRDAQFQGRIMDTAQFPTATFKLTQPIDLGAAPADGKVINVQGTGDLTLHGTTKSVTVPLAAKRTGNTIQVSGSIPVTFADYNIDNPSFGGVTTKDHGTIEFLLVLNPS
jgi:polyisoprenoid-binding protein YceI